MLLVLLNITCLIILWEKHKQVDKISDYFLGKHIHHVFRNVFIYVVRILFNSNPQQMSLISAKKMAKKMHFLYTNGFIREICHIIYLCGKFGHFSTWNGQQLKTKGTQ